MATNRNRQAGHGFEREIVNELKDLGYPSLVTSRAESRNMDNRGVDIFDNGLEGGPEFPYYIQNKTMVNQPNFHKLITAETLPTNKPTIVFYRQTEKAGKRFMKRGDYVVMDKKTFYNLIKKNK